MIYRILADYNNKHCHQIIHTISVDNADEALTLMRQLLIHEQGLNAKYFKLKILSVGLESPLSI